MENKSKALEFLNIPRSTFYYDSILDGKDLELKEKIESVLDDNPSYGHKRIAAELKLGKKRIIRVMKKYDIRPRRKRRKPKNKRKDGEYEASPNLLVSLFPLFKNHIWITDFTYLKWRSRWVYVATVIDLFTREVAGHLPRSNSGLRSPVGCAFKQSGSDHHSFRSRQRVSIQIVSGNLKRF